ncbi:alpha/beta hydrolase [Amnibacterium kyonggiense]
MPLDPDTALMLQELQRRGLPGPADSDVPTARAVLRGISGADRRDPASLPRIGEIRDEVIGGVRCRVYRPQVTAPSPTIVYLHGGGFVIGDLDTHDLTVRLLATDVGAVVVSVDYGLAPERPFPGGVEDAWSVFATVAGRIEEFGGDPARLVVAGDSAGANLAAVTAVHARDTEVPLAAQLLAYPVVDPGGEYASRGENADGYFLTARDMDWFFEHYTGVAPGAEGARSLVEDPRIAPLRTPDLAGVAPAVIATAEYDPLRDEGVAYAAALVAAGVPVWHRTYEGQIHGFYGTPLPGALRATHEIDAALAELLR